LPNVLGQITGAPTTAISMTIQHIINNRNFHVQYGTQTGYILFKNNYFLFQPDVYRDTTIPMALRIADFPIKRDSYEPKQMDRSVVSAPLLLGGPGPNKPNRGPGAKEVPNGRPSDTAAPVEPEKLWNALVEWVTKITAGTQTQVGIEIERKIEETTSNFRQHRSVFMDKLEMIIFLSKNKDIQKPLYEQAVLEYLWDEWIHPSQQVRLLGTRNPLYTVIASEQILKNGPITVFRSINPITNVVDYTCEDGNPCSRSITETFQALSSDPVKQRKRDERTTGSLYGFMVPKRGTMIFKTTEPTDKFRAVSGQECATITTKSHWLDKLVHIGDHFTTLKQPNLGLDKEHLSYSTDIINSTRGCTVLDLILRYVDKIGLQGKRWFFRPIAAYLTGHRGLVSTTAKAASQEAQKQLKKQETEFRNESAPSSKKKGKVSTATKKLGT